MVPSSRLVHDLCEDIHRVFQVADPQGEIEDAQHKDYEKDGGHRRLTIMTDPHPAHSSQQRVSSSPRSSPSPYNRQHPRCSARKASRAWARPRTVSSGGIMFGSSLGLRPARVDGVGQTLGLDHQGTFCGRRAGHSRPRSLAVLQGPIPIHRIPRPAHDAGLSF
jgi:hypothetical protein